MAGRTCFPLLHVLLLAGSALSGRLVTGQPGLYFSGFDGFLMYLLQALPEQYTEAPERYTEVRQANHVVYWLAQRYGSRLDFAVAIYSFPVHGSGSFILPDEEELSVDAHTTDGAAASPDCSTTYEDPPECCVESGGSLMRYFKSTELLEGTQQKVVKRAMVFWWPKTEGPKGADYLQRWSLALDTGHMGYLWDTNSCGKYRGDNGFAGNIWASLLARCLYSSWVLGARRKAANSCRGLLFAPQQSTTVSDGAGHLIQTSKQFRLRHREDGNLVDYVKYKIVMLP